MISYFNGGTLLILTKIILKLGYKLIVGNNTT